jgi:hypothetical protein
LADIQKALQAASIKGRSIVEIFRKEVKSEETEIKEGK